MDKKYTIRTLSSSGEVVDESKIVLKKGSMLIQTFEEGAAQEYMARCHRNLAEVLEKNATMISVPSGVKLQVLEVE